MKMGEYNTVSFDAATTNFTAEDVDVITYMFSREGGFRNSSFSQAVLQNRCYISYELKTGRDIVQKFHLSDKSCNLARTMYYCNY